MDNFAPVKKGKERIHKADNYVQFAYEQKEANCNHRIGRRFPADILVFLTFPRALISPEAAVSSLAVDLNKAAEEKNLRGYISSIENIEGRQDEAIAKLKNDLNAALFAYKKWNVLVGEDDRTAVKDKINLYMNRWKGMLSAETFYRLAQREAGVIREIKYYPLAAWQYVSEEKNL
ncbi:MAG: hypothetical protein COS41_03555, partial [Elusimicrobia bacterium CG03_land_8_20_14_0_80_50_18]